MDIVLLKTFLNVMGTESFVAAAERMFITQAAISQRVQKLEDLVGHRLFERSKSGVSLTIEGQKFEPYARSMLQLWDEAVYQTSLPNGYTGSLTLACQDSLWPELSARWLSLCAEAMPKTAFSFQLGMPLNLSNMLLRGVLDIAILYNPEIRQGFKVEHVLDDRLVMVSAKENHDGKELGEDYVFANWGPEFSMNHARWFPDLKPPQIMLQVGDATPQYLINNNKTAYMPYRIADDYVAAKKLHFVSSAPTLPYPAYAVWTEYKAKLLLDQALEQLREAAKLAPWIEL